MGNTTILYGYILAPGDGSDLNTASVAALPEKDSWPYLTSDLFAIPAMEHTYNDQLLTFGTVYKNLDLGSGWLAWRAKFEALLRTMCWDEAHVYLNIENFGRCHFAWKQDVWRPSDFAWPQGTKRALSILRETTRKPVDRWTFSGGPLEESNH